MAGERRRWTPEAVVAAVQARQAALPLNAVSVVRDDEALAGAARRLFGSWRAALAAAGIPVPPRGGRLPRHPPGTWSPERVLDLIRAGARAGRSLAPHAVDTEVPGLVPTGQRLFGS